MDVKGLVEDAVTRAVGATGAQLLEAAAARAAAAGSSRASVASSLSGSAAQLPRAGPSAAPLARAGVPLPPASAVPDFEAELQRRLDQFHDDGRGAAALAASPLSPQQRAALDARGAALAAARGRTVQQWQLASPKAYGYDVSAALAAPLPGDGAPATSAKGALAVAPPAFFGGTPRTTAPDAGLSSSAPSATAAAAAAAAAGFSSRADLEAELAVLMDRVRAMGGAGGNAAAARRAM
jgi:hypothetical protein